MFDISVQNQFDKSGISKGQFVKLMESASKGLPDAYFTGVRLDRLDGRQDDYSRGEHSVFLTFANGPSVEGALVEQMLHVKRSRNGWRIAINELPFRLVRLHGGTTVERWARLAESLEQAGIEEYWLGVNGPILTPRAIRRHLAGEIDVFEIYKQAPRG